jgi:hypothetical protein
MRIITIVFFAFISTELFAQFSGGNGTESDPYQIATYNDLEYLSNNDSYWNAHFIQTANINASASNNGGVGFVPIGTQKVNDDQTITKTAFTGNYDGGNHKVSNLYMDRDGNVPIGSDLGLFGYTVGATIKNLGVEDADISGHNCTGALIGSAENTTVINCHTSGTVYGKNYMAGGLIGKISNTTITDCYSSCNTTGFIHTGGLVGDANACTISNSHATGEVFGHQKSDGMDPLNVGGLVGSLTKTNITNSYATGKVSTGGIVGGLIGTIGLLNGSVYDTQITECYATGNVSGTSEVGGLIGRVQGEVKKCYATGNVSGEGTNSINIGGFVGNNNEGVIGYCYSRGNVSGTTNVGGFAGKTFATPFSQTYGSIKYCYSTGTTTASSGHDAGFCAHNEGCIYQCFWNTETSGHTQGFDVDVYYGDYTGLSTQEMQSIAGFNNAFGFAGDGKYSIWAISTDMNDGFPVLFEQMETTSLADLGTLSLDSSTDTTATLSCTLANLGMPNPAKHGFCYSTTNTTPTINDSVTNLGEVTGSTPDGASFTDTINNLDPSKIYYIRAFATNYEGTVYSNTISTNVTTGISKITDDNVFTIYPNPAKDVLHIQYPDIQSATDYQIIIYNQIGGTVYQKHALSINDIDISHLSQGVYYLSVNQQIVKFVKI